MRIIKAVVVTVAALGLLVIGIYGWFLHAPAPQVPALGGELHTHTLNSGGLQRQLMVYQPVVMGPEKGMPVVFVFHGSAGTIAKVRAHSAYEFEQVADERGLLIVYPQGYDNHWNDCRGTADYAANVEDIDDVGFVRDMLELLQQHYPVDRDRIFATGFSNGGQMAYKLAFEVPELVAAIAPVSAGIPAPRSIDCAQSGVAVPTAIFNGTEDPVNPYAGGLVSILGNDSRGWVLSSMDSARYFAGLAGIETPPKTIAHPQQDDDPATRIIETRWRRDDGFEVRLYTLEGSGHVVPSKLRRFPRLLGGDAADMSGPREIVAFFMDQSSG